MRLSLVAVLLALAGCNRDLTCTTEVTAGAGTFRGAATGTQSEPDLRRESLRIACGQLCAAGSTKGEGCVGRCAVDAEAGKIGRRTTCSKESSPR